MGSIICRKKEQEELQDIFSSKEAEFIVVYGRRRVGKTFLVKNFFKKKPCVFFHITGIKDGLLEEQLSEFAKVIGKTFYHGATLASPSKWMKAFEELTNAINTVSKTKKVILFLDEFPWLVTKRSRLLQTLDYYWNHYWVNDPRIKLVICGSSASWIIKNILHNKGGLHNRTTRRLILKPFTLLETKLFLQSQGIKLNEKQVLQLYMAIGGIPHYLKYVKKSMSAIQNINNLCFKDTGLLYDEFDVLFSSLFDKSEVYLDLVKVIAKTRYGISRSDLESYTKSSFTGGRLTARLSALETAGFIKSFLPLGHTRQGLYYRIIDEFCYFYLTWIEPEKQTLLSLEADHKYWLTKSKSASYQSWAGYTFESICYKHLSSIRKALNILADARVGTWRHTPKGNQKERGAQIDLLFDRFDDSVTVCEIKYTNKAFILDKLYYNNVINKIKTYQLVTRTNKQVFVAFVSAAGLKKTIYSEELVDGIVTLEDLFN